MTKRLRPSLPGAANRVGIKINDAVASLLFAIREARRDILLKSIETRRNRVLAAWSMNLRHYVGDCEKMEHCVTERLSLQPCKLAFFSRSMLVLRGYLSLPDLSNN